MVQKLTPGEAGLIQSGLSLRPGLFPVGTETGAHERRRPVAAVVSPPEPLKVRPAALAEEAVATATKRPVIVKARKPKAAALIWALSPWAPSLSGPRF
jgi:hypothetical protein